jgi:peptidoglycan-N-acetylglucosamine deacetylase
LAEEIGGSVKLIEAYTGVRPRYYRPPYGRYDQRILNMADKYGLTAVLWDADAYDYYPRQSSRNITYYILRKTRPGSIILLHEKRENTVRALPYIIQTLKDKGYKFVDLP